MNALAKKEEAKVGEVVTGWERVGRNFMGGGGNLILDGGGEFFISYNPNPGCGLSIFNSDDGSDETALCIRKGAKDGGTRYLILNGDFRKEYEAAFALGLDACRKVYEDNKEAHGSSWTTGDDA